MPRCYRLHTWRQWCQLLAGRWSVWHKSPVKALVKILLSHMTLDSVPTWSTATLPAASICWNYALGREPIGDLKEPFTTEDQQRQALVDMLGWHREESRFFPALLSYLSLKDLDEDAYTWVPYHVALSTHNDAFYLTCGALLYNNTPSTLCPIRIDPTNPLLQDEARCYLERMDHWVEAWREDSNFHILMDRLYKPCLQWGMRVEETSVAILLMYHVNEQGQVDQVEMHRLDLDPSPRWPAWLENWTTISQTRVPRSRQTWKQWLQERWAPVVGRTCHPRSHPSSSINP